MKVAQLEPGLDLPFPVSITRDGAVNMGAFTLPALQPGRAVDDSKPYQKGDPVRFIDWRSYARTNKLYIREKIEQTRVGVEIFVDGGASMAFPDSSMPEQQGRSPAAKLAWAMRLAYFLGYEFADLGEQVTVCLKGGDLLTGLLAQCSDRKLIKSHFHQLSGSLADAQQIAEAALQPSYTPSPGSRRFRIVISDALTTDMNAWFDRLGGGRGLFIHSLSQLELDLSWMASDDVYFDHSGKPLRTTGKSFHKYQDQVEQQKSQWLTSCEDHCQQRGWTYQRVTDDEPVDHFMANFASCIS